ncbi:unnamed protein product [Meganyctiphanes norvegica]|uniref:Uncharacterized protein n=1 Tax=Meganyctiphanes norvegica TaxID=48144 RepID=A0AAV2PIN3_MEGNR
MYILHSWADLKVIKTILAMWGSCIYLADTFWPARDILQTEAAHNFVVYGHNQLNYPTPKLLFIHTWGPKGYMAQPMLKASNTFNSSSVVSWRILRFCFLFGSAKSL